MMENYSLEVDFLPVGEENMSGDAIALRFGICEGGRWKDQTIFIIDGGDAKSGEALVQHVREVYKSDTVDRVILTHPDRDHASGLRTVIEELKVGKIWMHRPWRYWGDLKDSIVDGRITKGSFSDALREAYQYAHEIEEIATRKNIEIYQPHQGGSYTVSNEKVLTILGPSKEFYLSLIQASGKTPNMGMFESVRKPPVVEKKLAFEDMSFETEHLSEMDIATSAENDMSLVLLLSVAGAKILFTGDAGTQSLFKAIMYASQQGIGLKDLTMLQVPHHGSRHNLSKGILKYISGTYGLISCSRYGAPKHPSPIVTNSLLRRQINPYVTQGRLINFHTPCVPIRDGFNPVLPLPFVNHVEVPIDEHVAVG